MFFHRKKEEEKKEVPSPSLPTRQTEKKEEKKEGFPLAGKIACSLICLSLLALSVYSLVSLIRQGTGGGKSKEDYIVLEGKNVNETRDFFNQTDKNGNLKFSKDNKNKIKDYYFIGSKLFVSENKLTPSRYKDNLVSMAEGKDIALYSISSDVNYSYNSNLSTKISSSIAYIDLNQAREGDYLLYPIGGTEDGQSGIAPYSIDSDEGIEESVYTLPDKEGKRKRVTLKNNRNSPYTILSVRNCGSHLPSNCYDILLRNQQYKETQDGYRPIDSSGEDLSSLAEKLGQDSLSVKAVSSLSEASKRKSSLLFTLPLEEGKGYTSLFTPLTSLQTKVRESSDLKGYDAIPEIREAVGALEHAGEYYYNVPYNNVPPSSAHIGKESILLPYSDDSYSTAKEVYALIRK